MSEPKSKDVSTSQIPQAAGINRAPPRFSDHHIAFLLGTASALTALEFFGAIGVEGLPESGWRVLAALTDFDGIIVTDLANRVMIKQPTLTKLLDRMSRDGLIERRQTAIDRRRTEIFLTDHGRRLAIAMVDYATKQEADLLRGLDDEAIKAALLRLIVRCREMRADRLLRRSRRPAVLAG